MKLRTLGALALCTQLGGCFFFMIHTRREEPAPRTVAAPPMTRANLTACRDLDRAQRLGTFSDEQAAKRVMTDLALNEADCKRLLAEADK